MKYVGPKFRLILSGVNDVRISNTKLDHKETGYNGLRFFGADRK